jgi:hypothetical protein
VPLLGFRLQKLKLLSSVSDYLLIGGIALSVIKTFPDYSHIPCPDRQDAANLRLLTINLKEEANAH